MRVREPAPGEVLGQSYVIEQELGRGGFGVVYKARHIAIDRVVAIKVLLATYAQKDPSAKERFKREATIAASLDYPNSLRIFDYGQTDEGVFYIVMEFLAGKDLTKVLKRDGPMPIPRAVHIIRQVLHALMEAHSRGIVHRDIKPDNVMLVSLAYDPDYVKVMDFGIAKMVDAGDQITRAGLTLGTPRYMPIEQLKGERLSPATDLYAVGLVFYEMLVGKPAFEGDTAVDTAIAVMQGGAVRVPVEARVPEGVAAIIEKAAAPAPADRFQSAREFLEALNGLDAGLLDGDAAEREHFVTSGRGTRPELRALRASAPKTIAMPELDGDSIPPGGDFEDIVRTQSLDTSAVSGGLSTPARMAATQTLEVLSSPPEAPEPSDPQSNKTMTVLTTLATPAVTSEHEVAPKTPGAPTWFGAPPILVVLNLSLLLVALVTLFRLTL
jgi:serine/threonine-protein kinase